MNVMSYMRFIWGLNLSPLASGSYERANYSEVIQTTFLDLSWIIWKYDKFTINNITVSKSEVNNFDRQYQIKSIKNPSLNFVQFILI